MSRISRLFVAALCVGVLGFLAQLAQPVPDASASPVVASPAN